MHALQPDRRARLDLVRVDHARQRRDRHDVGAGFQPFFEEGGSGGGAVDLTSFAKAPWVQMTKRPRCPPGASVSSREAVHGAELDAGDVAHRLHERERGDRRRARRTPRGGPCAARSGGAHLALPDADVFGILNLFDIRVGADRLEQRNRLGRLGNGLRRLVDDQGDFGHGLHGVAARHQREGTADAASAEHTAQRALEVDAAVPAAPRLGGRERRGRRGTCCRRRPGAARCVPPPGTRGIRDTARPVPQDSAAVW